MPIMRHAARAADAQHVAHKTLVKHLWMHLPFQFLFVAGACSSSPRPSSSKAAAQHPAPLGSRHCMRPVQHESKPAARPKHPPPSIIDHKIFLRCS